MISGWVAELRRRKVFRVAALYAATGFVVLQAADLILPGLMLPEWTYRMLVLLVLLGFPIALVLTWAFDITPDGVVRTEAASESVPRPDLRRRGALGIAALAGLATVALAGVVIALGGGVQRGGGGEIRSVAVLPFADLSEDGDQEFFSDGITEEILDALAGVDGLRVAARTSSFSFKGQNTDVREIARVLGVSAVLEGSVRRSGDRLRIHAHLSDARRGYRLWSESYDRELTDVFAVQDEIARSIVDALRLRLEGSADAPLVRERTADPAAHALYLRGLEAARTRLPDDLLRAADFLRQAVDRDPGYAVAHAGLAFVYILLEEQLEDAMERSRAATDHALRLDPALAEAHVTRAYLLDRRGQTGEAEGAYQRALALKPSYAQALHWYAMFLASEGRPREALATIARGAQLDPLSPALGIARALLLAANGARQEALDEARRMSTLHPEHVWPLVYVGRFAAELGREEEARRATEAALRLGGHFAGVRFNAALNYAVLGDRTRALEHFQLWRDSVQIPEQDNWQAAAVYAALGDHEESFRALEGVIAIGSVRFWLQVSSAFDTLRDDPRFVQLLQRRTAAMENHPVTARQALGGHDWQSRNPQRGSR